MRQGLISLPLCMYRKCNRVCVCVCVCARAWVRVFACVRAWVRACVCVRVNIAQYYCYCYKTYFISIISCCIMTISSTSIVLHMRIRIIRISIFVCKKCLHHFTPFTMYSYIDPGLRVQTAVLIHKSMSK